jgi:hypothetical protein
MQDGLILTFMFLSVLGVYLNSLTLKILAGMTMTMAGNAAHNFVHMKENWRRYYMDFGFLSSYQWRISHVLSHHNYPNTVLVRVKIRNDTVLNAWGNPFLFDLDKTFAHCRLIS